MKASEAKPLDAAELETLRSLMQRWILCSYPYESGCSEESDAQQTYFDIADDAEAGKMRLIPSDEEKEGYQESKLK